jgi:hypothetical protein
MEILAHWLSAVLSCNRYVDGCGSHLLRGNRGETIEGVDVRFVFRYRADRRFEANGLQRTKRIFFNSADGVGIYPYGCIMRSASPPRPVEGAFGILATLDVLISSCCSRSEVAVTGRIRNRRSSLTLNARKAWHLVTWFLSQQGAANGKCR